MKTTAQLTFEKVRHDEATDAHLVVSLTAPHRDSAAPRAPVCVVPVVDVSGSMSGAKLHFAKQSILKLIDHLAPGDAFGLVTFSSEVETLAPVEAMTPARKESLKAVVGRLEAQANTNLAGGLLAGLAHARDAQLPEGVVVRVILFTDGQANAGPATSAEDLERLLAANLGRATLSAFGYGRDPDQDLLRRLSDVGKGNYAYVGSPEDALTAFARELGGLLSAYAQGLEVRVTPREGAALTYVVSDVDAREELGAVVIRMGELLADEVRHLVLGVRLAPRAVPVHAPVAIAEVDVSWTYLDAGRPVKARAACKATVRFVAPAEAQQKPTPSVDAVVAVAELVRAQIEAEEAARAGHFGEARQVMRLFQAAVSERGHGAVGETAAKLADGLGDADSYDRSRAYRSSMRKGSTRSVASKLDDAAEQDLRAMGRSQGTAAQERMERSFGAPAHPSSAGAPRRGRLERKRSSRW
ncbi:MAG TPA: VWA domain-containing protein [Anaeromyxobacteraceae bacterium]|nr:VWA domain-containing protein [Anaeromyxobacteraceae bacterium]